MEAGTFLVLVVLILHLIFMNLTLSIVMDGYGMVKKRAFSGDTLFTEIAQLWTRMWHVHRGDWVPLSKVLTALLEMEQKTRLRVQESRDARKAGRGSQKAESNTLIGRDTKCVPGARVMPVENDIYWFVGQGVVEMV